MFAGGWAPSWKASLSAPSRTCQGWVSSCMQLGQLEASKPPSHASGQESSEPCVWAPVNKRSLSAHKENAISLPSSPGRNSSSPKVSRNTRPLGAPIDLDSFQSPGKNGSSNFVNVPLFTDRCLLVFPSYEASQPSALVPQRRRWPVAHPVLRGSAVPVSSVGVGMCRLGRVHSRRVSRPNTKIMLGFFKQHTLGDFPHVSEFYAH